VALQRHIEQRFNITASDVRVDVTGDSARVVFLGTRGTSLALALLTLPSGEKQQWGITAMSPVDSPTPVPDDKRNGGVDTSGSGRKTQLLLFFITPFGVAVLIVVAVCIVRGNRANRYVASEGAGGLDDESLLREGNELRPVLQAPERSAAPS